MKTVVAETVLLGRAAFETLGETVVLPDRQIGPDALRDADALIIRSKTKITPALLEGSALRFIGTATAGFEHIAAPELERRSIGWCCAPGCNADSVADYMTAALLHLHARRGVALKGKTIGLIGAGQVGSRTARRAEALGLRVLLNDPPRAEREGSAAFCGLDELLASSDMVSLHVPLTSDGPWLTRRLAGDAFFARLRRGAVFINAARGPVLDSDALLRAIAAGTVAHAVLDVWDPEPLIRADVLAAADLGTPHIAGHSFEGKLNGTVQVYQEACRFFGLRPVWDPAPALPPPAVPELRLKTAGKSDLQVLAEAVEAVYDITADRIAPEDIVRFDRLRAAYRVRREFRNTAVEIPEERPDLCRRLVQAGFRSAHAYR